MSIRQLNAHVFASSDFVFDHSISSLIVEGEFFVDFTHLYLRISYNVFEVIAVIVEITSHILKINFEFFDLFFQSFKFAVCLSLVTKFEIVDFFRKHEYPIFSKVFS